MFMQTYVNDIYAHDREADRIRQLSYRPDVQEAVLEIRQELQRLAARCIPGLKVHLGAPKLLRAHPWKNNAASVYFSDELTNAKQFTSEDISDNMPTEVVSAVYAGSKLLLAFRVAATKKVAHLTLEGEFTFDVPLTYDDELTLRAIGKIQDQRYERSGVETISLC